MCHLQVPLQALDRRVIHRGGNPVQQVLIKWSDMDDVLSTWEDEEALRDKFPAAPAWGQAAYQGEDNQDSDTARAEGEYRERKRGGWRSKNGPQI
jgi:hypothetical protein